MVYYSSYFARLFAEINLPSCVFSFFSLFLVSRKDKMRTAIWVMLLIENIDRMEVNTLKKIFLKKTTEQLNGCLWINPFLYTSSDFFWNGYKDVASMRSDNSLKEKTERDGLTSTMKTDGVLMNFNIFKNGFFKYSWIFYQRWIW